MRYPLRLELNASRYAFFLITAVHGVAAAGFMLSGASLWIVATGILVLAASLRHAIRAEKAKDGLSLVLEDSGRLRTAITEDAPVAQPLPGSVDFGWAVWLQWQTIDDEDDKKREERGAIMLFPDNLSSGMWRLLRIWMRHKASRALNSPRRS